MKLELSAIEKDSLPMSYAASVKEIKRRFRVDEYDKNMDTYSKMALTHGVRGYGWEVLRVRCEIAQNFGLCGDTFDYYGDGTRDLDVWISVIGYNGYNEFARIGMWLSDVLSLFDPATDECIASVHRFKEI